MKTTSLKVNGKAIEVAAKNVAELVVELNLHPNTILVEHNLRALLRTEWQKTKIDVGDQIEILHVVAGG